MVICERCRCKDVCSYQYNYEKEVTAAKEAYKPEIDIFETTIRCNKYIPEIIKSQSADKRERR